MAKKQKRNQKKTHSTREKGRQSTPVQPGIWARQTDIVQHGICLLLLTVVSFSFFAPLHFSGKSLFAYDTVSFKAMANAMQEYEKETGEKALWSSNPFGGMPSYMISTPLEVAQADDIPRMLRRIIWPSSHFLFLLFGTYLLVYYLVQNKWAAVLAACAYGLTTYIPIIIVAGHNSKFITMAFSPWLILSFAYILRRPTLLAGLLFSAILAINLRAGHIQITYYVAFLLGVWWIVEGVGAVRDKNLKPFLRSTGWLALGSMLGILMVAQPYLSNFEYKAFTIRGAAPGGASSGLAWDYAMEWSQGIGELITLLISDAYGGSDAYWGPKLRGTGGPHYVGGIVLLLAALAVYKVRTRTVWAFGISVGFMTLFSLGIHFEALSRFMFNYFPLFSSFRVPETWLSVVALLLAVLAGFGLREALQATRNDSLWNQTALKGAGVGVGFCLLLLVFNTSIFEFGREGEEQMIARQIAQQNSVSPTDPQVTQLAQQYKAQITETRIERFQDDTIRTILFLLGLGIVLGLYYTNRIPMALAGLLMALLVTIDLADVGRRYFNEDVLIDAKTVDDAVPEYAFDGFLVQKKEEAGGNGHFRVLSLAEGHPSQVARPAYFYETLGGYHGAKLRVYQDYLENILFDPARGGLPNENALDLLNTRYIVAGGQWPGAVSVFQDDQTGLVVSDRANALPRAYFVGEVEVVESPERIWEQLRSDTFDLSAKAILEEAPDFQLTPIDSTSTTDVTLKTHTPHEIKWQVQTDAPRLLVVSEVYYPAGWKAFVDEEEAPIYKTNYLLRGVPVPAGEHEITMRFEPASYRIGFWFSAGSTLLVYAGIVVLLGLGYLQRKKSKGVDANAAND